MKQMKIELPEIYFYAFARRKSEIAYINLNIDFKIYTSKTEYAKLYFKFYYDRPPKFTDLRIHLLGRPPKLAKWMNDNKNPVNLFIKQLSDVLNPMFGYTSDPGKFDYLSVITSPDLALAPEGSAWLMDASWHSTYRVSQRYAAQISSYNPLSKKALYVYRTFIRPRPKEYLPYRPNQTPQPLSRLLKQNSAVATDPAFAGSLKEFLSFAHNLQVNRTRILSSIRNSMQQQFK